MPTVPAAPAVLRRFALVVGVLVAGLVATGAASSSHAVGSSPSAEVVPASTCRGADDRAAPLAVQQSAVACLLNSARRRAGRLPLATPPKLRRAAAIKGNEVALCGQLSHAPCGDDPTEALRTAGYRHSWFGENLWFGTWGRYTARDVVASWLASPGHRANVLRPSFRHLGVARVRARGIFGEANTAVWVATFASPR